MKQIHRTDHFIRNIYRWFLFFLSTDVYFGRHMARVPNGAIVFFPYHEDLLCCGLVGIVSIKNKNKSSDPVPTASLESKVKTIETRGYMDCQKNHLSMDKHYLGGEALIRSMLQSVQAMKRNDLFLEIFQNKAIQTTLAKLTDRLKAILEIEEKFLTDRMGQHLLDSSLTIYDDANEMETLRQPFDCEGRPIFWNSCIRTCMFHLELRIQSGAKGIHL